MSKQFSLKLSMDYTIDIYGRSVQQLHCELHPTNYYWLQNLLNTNPALSYEYVYVEPNFWHPWKSKIVIDFYC